MMSRLMKLLYSTAVFDVLFAAMGLVVATGLVVSTGHGMPGVAPAASPLVKGATVFGVLLAGALLSSSTTRMDQKLADDYLFQTLSKSALMAIMGFIFAMVLWKVLFEPSMGALFEYTVMGVLVGAWSISYFFTRIRGTRA